MQIGFLGLLELVFIVLKLTHVIDWNWWWVTSPLWGGLAVVILVFVVLRFLLVPILGIYNRIFHKKEYEYMKKLNKSMSKKPKGSFQEKLSLLEEQQEKLRKE